MKMNALLSKPIALYTGIAVGTGFSFYTLLSIVEDKYETKIKYLEILLKQERERERERESAK